jgi:hypothetical protein
MRDDNFDDVVDAVERTLTLTNYGEDEFGKPLKNRVTLAPGMIQTVIASFDSVKKIDGHELYKVNVLYSDGNQLELFLNFLELTTIERIVGMYLLP